MRAIGMWLLGLLSLAVAIMRGNAHKAKAESAQKDADTLKLQRVARDEANDAMDAGRASQEAAIKEVEQDENDSNSDFTNSKY